MRAPTYEVGGLTVEQPDRRLKPEKAARGSESDIPNDPRHGLHPGNAAPQTTRPRVRTP